MSATAQAMPMANDASTQNDSRCWGTFSCIGTAYGKIVANFATTAAPTTTYTVVVPANLENFAQTALERKLTVLASFSGPLAAYVTITDLIIYN